MLTKLSRILVVFTTAVSIAFMGTVLAIRGSGPNWIVESQNLPDYAFSQSTGENPQWSGQHRKEAQPVATSAVLPDVIAKAYDDAQRRNKEQIKAILPQIPPVEQRTAATKSLLESDQKGLEVRVTMVEQLIADINKQINDVAVDGDRKAGQAVEIRAEAEELRGAVARLKRQLQQVHADHYQLREQRRRLLDLLHQTRGLHLRLQERHEQLIQDGAVAPAAAPTT